jgi:hypothetical protein
LHLEIWLVNYEERELLKEYVQSLFFRWKIDMTCSDNFVKLFAGSESKVNTFPTMHRPFEIGDHLEDQKEHLAFIEWGVIDTQTYSG